MTSFFIKPDSDLFRLLFVGVGVVACAVLPVVANDDGKTITYRAEIPQGVWPGWDFHPEPNAPKPTPEQFEIVTTDGKSARTFSGKIVGPKSMKGVEVGLESLIGIPWIHDDLYQWEKVSADGTFLITDAHHLDADKAIAMRGPDTAWTFLRFNFAPNHGAKDIVLNAAPGKKVTLTASSPDRKNVDDVWVEIFDAYSQVDDRGNWLNRQRLGTCESDGKGKVVAVLPIGEVALFVHGEGWAGFYQIVDTRKADRFHFVLMPGGELKLRTLDKEGKPKAGVGANWKNPAAPLSYWGVKTDSKGEFVGHGLVPGTFEVNVPGFAVSRVEVQPNATTEAVFQEGQAPVITHGKSTAASK